MILGVTGGIGSGKSTVCEIFKLFGIPVYNSDDRAKWLMNHQPELISAIKEQFGEEAYRDGRLNREYLAQTAFSDKQSLQKLNDLVHPSVRKDFKQWVTDQQSAILIKEAAILIESGAYRQCDKVLVVTCPTDIRLERVVARDQSNAEQVKRRMENQLTDDQRLEFADFVIDNSGKELLIPQVKEVLEKLG